ncbi:MAG: GntR family transcriptional regulator [Pseudomonadota bacterium]
MSTGLNSGSAWKDVYRQLRQQIKSNDLVPGTRLPTIGQLATSCGLSRHGARRVLERLRAEGFAQSWQGKGFTVAIPHLRIRVQNCDPSFHETVESAGRVSGSELVSNKTVGMPTRLSGRLRHMTGERVEMTETLRRVDGRVYALSTDYFPSRRFQRIPEVIAKTGSVSQALASHGVRTYMRDHTDIRARLPTAHEALMLRVPRQQPVYETIGANIDRAGRVVQVSTAVWRADCVTFEL